MHWSNVLVAGWNFVELGCPSQEMGYGPESARRACAVPPAWAWDLLSEVRSFGCPWALKAHGNSGRDRLEALVRACALNSYLGSPPTIDLEAEAPLLGQGGQPK